MAARRDAYEAQHAKNRIKYEKEVWAAFRDICFECGYSVTQMEAFVKAAGQGANIAQIPAVRKVLDKLQRRLAKRLKTTVIDGVKAEWKLANDKYDALIGTMVAGDLLSQMSEERKARTYNRNMEALDAFLSRKEQGLDLSQRVWQYTGQMRDAMEAELALGISEGESAAEIARDLQEYLIYPDKLFRRVRDKETGELKLSKPASMFHPGQGVNRSSYKNALRLALNETNIAYRKADTVRRVGLSFVVGIEVHLSNNHNCVGVPEGKFFDICDILQGKYPPDFDFSGWHPNCRCWTSTIMQTDEEFVRDRDGVYRGSVNEVKDLPPQFKQWLEENADRIQQAEERGTLPYFLRDNQWAWKEDAERPNEKKVNTALEIAEQRHAARTPEQVQAIKNRWKERNLAVRNANRVLRLVDSVPGMREYLKESGPMAVGLLTGEIPHGGNYVKLYVAATVIKNRMRELRDSLSFLDKPWEVLKEHGVEKSILAQEAVEKKMAQWSGQSLEYQLKKLRFEAQWIEDNKKGVLSTWKVAQDAYLKAAREVEWKIEWEEINNKFNELRSSQYASPELVAKVQSFIGKDKSAAETALAELEKQVKVAELRAEYESYLAEAPGAFNEAIRWKAAQAFDSGDPNQVEFEMASARTIIKMYRDFVNDAAVYMAQVKDQRVKDALTDAVNKQALMGLSDAIGLAKREIEFQQQVEAARKALLNRDILAKLKPQVVTWLEERMVPKDYTDTDIQKLRSAVNQADTLIQEWYEKVKEFVDNYLHYVCKAPDYADYVKNAQEAVKEVDQPRLEYNIAKLKEIKDRLEAEKAQRAALAAEWQKMKGDVAAIRNALNEDSDLLSKAASSGLVLLISDFDNNASGPKKVREARVLYQQIRAKAAELGVGAMGAGSVTFGSECFTKARKDAAVWDTREAARADGREHGELADQTLFKDASDAWKSSIDRERKAKALIAKYEAGEISKEQFEAMLKAQGLFVYSFDYGGSARYMTEREAMYEYTHHYCDVNEPLEGRQYENRQAADRFYAKANAMTNIIGTSRTPKDMWFQRGDGDTSVIFSRLRFAGETIAREIEAAAQISGSKIDDSVINALQSLVGMTMQEGGFMSMGSAKGKGFTESYSKRVILNIYAPAGTMALYSEHYSQFGNGRQSASWDGSHATSTFSTEFETIAQRGTKMRITKVEKGTIEGVDYIYIDVEIVAQEVRDLSYVKTEWIGR